MLKEHNGSEKTHKDQVLQSSTNLRHELYASNEEVASLRGGDWWRMWAYIHYMGQGGGSIPLAASGGGDTDQVHKES